MLKIWLEYRLAGGTGWERVELSPEEYFDQDPRFPQGELKVTSAPRYFHAVDYLNVDASRLQETRLRIVDEAHGAERFIQETFWDDGRSRIIQRHDTGSTGDDRLIIVDLRVSEHPETYHILRVQDNQGRLELRSHLRTQSNDDGTSTDEYLFPEST